MTDQPYEQDEHPLEEDYPDAETLEEEVPLGVTEEHPADAEDDDSE